MTILLKTRNALAGDANDAPADMLQCLRLCINDLTVDELKIAKTRFPDEFVKDPIAEKSIPGDPAVGTTADSNESDKTDEATVAVGTGTPEVPASKAVVEEKKTGKK